MLFGLGFDDHYTKIVSHIVVVVVTVVVDAWLVKHVRQHSRPTARTGRNKSEFELQHEVILCLQKCLSTSCIDLYGRMLEYSRAIPHEKMLILLPLTCEDKRPNGRGEHENNVGQISNQNKGDMMKIKMKHHARSYCVVEFKGTIPNWSAWLEFSSILW